MNEARVAIEVASFKERLAKLEERTEALRSRTQSPELAAHLGRELRQIERLRRDLDYESA